MFEFLNNPIILLACVVPIILFLGFILGNFFSQPRKARVLKVSPESFRGVELEVKAEDSVSVYCDSVGNIPPQKFIKRLNAYNIAKKGWFKLQNFALWFGRYGTAYVFHLGSDEEYVTLKEAVHNIFGKKLYNQIPKAQKDQIESGQLGVTISFPKEPLTPLDGKGEPLPSISESDIRRDDDARAMGNLWDEMSKEQKKSMIVQVAWMGSGIAIGIIICMLMGWGAPIVVTPPSPGVV